MAKTKQAETSLRVCLQERRCQKRYRAIVFGKLEGGAGQPSLKRESGEKIKEDAFLTSSSDRGVWRGEGKGEVESPINGKPSLTRYEVIRRTRCDDPRAGGGWITTVDLYPVTGRKHQLRRHMKMLGHPIWGDRRYAPYVKSPTTIEGVGVGGRGRERRIDPKRGTIIIVIVGFHRRQRPR